MFKDLLLPCLALVGYEDREALTAPNICYKEVFEPRNQGGGMQGGLILLAEIGVGPVAPGVQPSVLVNSSVLPRPADDLNERRSTRLPIGWYLFGKLSGDHVLQER